MAKNVTTVLLLKDKVSAALKKVRRNVYATSHEMKKIGDKTSNLGSTLTKSVTAPIMGAVGASVKIGTEFDAQMSRVKAVSGATNDEFGKLRETAIQMGNDTKFTATEVAQSMENMALMGWKSQDSIKGIKGVLDLAAASGEELANVSNIVTTTLNAFGQDASKSTNVADLMASTVSNSGTNIEQMGIAFKHASTLAGSLGYSMKDTSLAVGLMANMNVKGGQAGRALRMGLKNLVNPTKTSAETMKKYGISLTDSNGKMKSLKTLIEELRSKFGKMDEKQKASAAASLFGSEAMAGWLAIINNSDKDFNKLSKALDNSKNTASKMSEEMLDNNAGAFTILKSKIESAAISIDDALAPRIRRVTKRLQGWVDKFNKMNQHEKDMILNVGLFVAAIGPALKIFGELEKIIAAFGFALSDLIGGLAKGKGLGALISGPTLAAIGIFAALAVVIGLVAAASKKHWKEISQHAKDAVEKMSKDFKRIGDSLAKIFGEKNSQALIDKILRNVADIIIKIIDLLPVLTGKLADFLADKKTQDFISNLVKGVSDIGVKFDGLTDKVKKFSESEFFTVFLPLYINRFRDDLSGLSNEFGKLLSDLKGMPELFSEIAGGFKPFADAFDKLLTKTIPMALDMCEAGTVLFFDHLIQGVTNTLKIFRGFFEIFAGLFTLNFEKIKEGWMTVCEGLGQLGINLLGMLTGIVTNALGMLTGYLTTTLGSYYTFILGLWNNVGKYIWYIVKKLLNGFLELIGSNKEEALKYVEEFKENFKAIIDGIPGLVDDICKDFTNIFTDYIATCKEEIEGLIDKFKSIPDNASNFLFGNFGPGHATGTTYHSGGTTWVGEHGPELVTLPSGSKVYPHTRSMNMGGGQSVVVNVNVAGNVIGNSEYANYMAEAVSSRILVAMANT